jgi:DedD protein
MNRAKADEEASKLTSAGYTAFVEDATVGGESWHRVRVGHYSTQQDAQEAAAQLQKMMEGVVWVAKVGK